MTTASLLENSAVFDDGTVEFGGSFFKCSCKQFTKTGLSDAWCKHIEIVLRDALDAAWTFENVISKDDPVTLEVPLFEYLDNKGLNARYLYIFVSVKPVTTPLGPVGVCRFEVPTYPSIGTDAGDLPGTLKAGGKSFASAGVILDGEGRGSIGTSVSSWVAAQLALAPGPMVNIECESYTHPRDAGLSPKDQICIILTGQCINCYTDKPDVSGDVPVF